GLPFGAFDPAGDRTLELSLRRWVREQTGFDIGYVEQLYTFGDRGREAPLPDAALVDRVISVGYLALTPERAALDQPGAAWADWYRFFPYEDWRGGRPALIDSDIAPLLKSWAGADQTRATRARMAFALDGAPWNEERALERFELLYEAGLTPEAARDRARYGGPPAIDAPASLGDPMTSDHRRILATAMSRLRGKLKYRPIVFELMPARFTLLHLQRVVEAISGLELHKQNFRRLLDRTGLVEGAGIFETRTGGRPAELFRFRREALTERPVGGVHVPTPRT
ncbi:MAG: NAD regulator, partial [Alphaproteobacteria bacterium]|nr:NAD regulator [Alphaproteobacteria bacterium]